MRKIALVHDYIKEYGGAERVLETLHEIYPDAPVYTLIYAPQFLGPHKNRFKDWDIRPSFLQFIPFTYKFISIYRLIAPLVFKMFNFSKFDVVIVSATGAYSPNSIRTKLRTKNQELRTKHICYCHTPPRYLYGYKTAREPSNNPIIKAGVAIMCHVLRMVDFNSAQNVDVFIANSINVAQRIKKFYRKDSVVVYPPVNIPESNGRILKQVQDDKKYYLCGGRLARPKHIDLIVKACTELNISLKVFGKSFAGYGEELKEIAGNTIEFLGEISDAEKLELMKNAKAFIFAAEDEDFGIVPVEAMSQGTPVIAYKSGGVLETVMDGATGVFFDELTIESLKSAIKKLEALRLRSGEKLAEACYKQAQKFSKEEFTKGIKKVVESL